tara:strand:+ start:729 stop:1457 length:729 start_codon:yes stop_codon:yes gene_type:complete
MEIIGQNILSGLSAGNLEFEATNTVRSHCPLPTGVRMTNIVAYTDTSFSSDFLAPAGSVYGTSSFLRTEPGLSRAVNPINLTASYETMGEFKEAKGAFLPAGYIPWMITIDNNGSTITYTDQIDPATDNSAPNIRLFSAFFDPNVAPVSYDPGSPPTDGILIGGAPPAVTSTMVNSGCLSQVEDLSGASAKLFGWSEDRPLIINVQAFGVPLASLVTSRLLSGQVRVNILCVQVPGTLPVTP